MDAVRRKKARLAIDAMIRGLELDQVRFAYDQEAMPDGPDGWPALRVPAAIDRIGERPAQP